MELDRQEEIKKHNLNLHKHNSPLAQTQILRTQSVASNVMKLKDQRSKSDFEGMIQSQIIEADEDEEEGQDEDNFKVRIKKKVIDKNYLMST